MPLPYAFRFKEKGVLGWCKLTYGHSLCLLLVDDVTLALETS